MPQRSQHAQALVQGLGGSAKNANGRYHEWHRENGFPYFKKAGGGAYIYRVEARGDCCGMRCLSPTRVVNPHRSPGGKQGLKVSFAKTMPNLSENMGTIGVGVSKSSTQPLQFAIEDANEFDSEPAWVISAQLDATEGVLAICTCAEEKLSTRTGEDWEVNLNVASGRPKVTIVRAMVHFLRALNLRASDLNGLSDPYLIFQVTGKPDLTFQTEVDHKCLNPIWNIWQEIDAVEVGDQIEFTVMDWDEDGDDDLLGVASITLQPSGWKGDLHLKCGNTLKAGQLRVEVQIPPPIPPPKVLVRKPVARTGDPAAKLLSILCSGGNEAIGAAAVIESAALDEHRRSELFMVGIAQPLVKLLTVHNQEAKQKASSALANLAALNPCRRAIVSAGAVPLLVAVLGEESNAAKAEAARALEMIADREKVRSAIVAAGATQHIMTMLRSGAPPCIDRSACLLTALAASEVVADLFADVGAAPTLVQQLSAPNQTLQLSAVSALQKLSGSPAGKRAVTEAGIVKPLVGLLKHGVSETRAEAAATIDVLIGFPSNKQKDGEDADPRMQLVEEMVSIGAIDGLVDLIANHGTHIKTALGALARFATVTSTVTHLISCGVLPLLLALQSPGYDAVTQARAAETLQNMASTKANREAMEAALGRGKPREMLTRVLEAKPEWHATIGGLPVKYKSLKVAVPSGGSRRIVSATWKAEVKLRMDALEAKVASFKQADANFMVVGEQIPWPPKDFSKAAQMAPGQRQRPQSAGSLRMGVRGGASQDNLSLAGTMRPRPQSAGARLRSRPSSASETLTQGLQRPASAGSLQGGVLGRRISRSESVSNRPRLPVDQEVLRQKMVPVCHHEINLKAAQIARTWTE
mmetsp:Transcript_23211/g.51317  ORF Transcript_23211/g.51317 Transcript_23211/m.51317 type:complete len:867 (+) Transcript_23211:127-2727(+)